MLYGDQGGWWSHPALRITGIGTKPVVKCRCALLSGGEVGVYHAKTKFYLTPAGEYERHPLQMSFSLSPHALDGLEATVECTVEDAEGRSATVMRHVIFVRG